MDHSENLESWLDAAASAIQALVDHEFARVGTPEPGSALDQFGLRDGLTITREFLAHGEPGLALDHLLYITAELDLVLPADVRTLLVRAARQMNYPEAIWTD